MGFVYLAARLGLVLSALLFLALLHAVVKTISSARSNGVVADNRASLETVDGKKCA